MSYDCIYSINCIVNGTYGQHAIVFLGENCQVCRSLIENRSKRPTTFAVGAVADCTRIFVFVLAKVEFFRLPSSAESNNDTRADKPFFCRPHHITIPFNVRIAVMFVDFAV
jgi:hypothetical protein